jgi:hypothetical protein
MIFKFKKSKIELDCFTYIDQLPELFPIISSIDAVPSWYRSLPSHINAGNALFPSLSQSTIKGCAGITDYFKNSITIPNWIEHRFSIQPDGNMHFMGLREDMPYESHPKHIQMGSAMPDYAHIKLSSPWQFKENTGVKWAWIQSSWHQEDPCQYCIPPGIINYKEHHTTNINVLIPIKNSPKEIVIPAGEPLVQLVPMSDLDVSIHLHTIDYQEWTKMKSYVHSTIHSFLKTRKILRSKGD